MNVSEFNRPLTKEEKEFLDRLVEKLTPALRQIIRAKLRTPGESNADDCFQDVCYILCLHARRVMAHPDPEGWLCKTAYQTACNYARSLATRSARTVPLVDDLPAETDASVEDTVIEQLLFEQYQKNGVVERVLSMLTKTERDLYEKRYRQGRTVQEIAKERGTTPESVRAMLSRIRRKIFGNLEKYV